ncbi:MAG: hypothetical protein IJV30_04235 [Oscillospiraceae bacterium]|nr:hypothetical protein [Oscillospiraceae bacterium]
MTGIMNNTVSYGYGADRLKLLLMPAVCVLSFGLPGTVGSAVRDLCRAAPLAFYILCGFFVLTEEEEERRKKLQRAIRSTGIFFLVLTLFYLGLNALIFTLQGVDWVGSVLRKRVLFNFVVLCVWPFQTGECLWFIQSLFYAWVLLRLLDLRGHLPVLILPLFLVTTILMLFSGEFAGLIHLIVLGYTYIPANAVTRALPYLLLGALLRRRSERLFLTNPLIWGGLLILGMILGLVEILLLSYTGKLVYVGHTIGYGVTAFALCCIALVHPEEELGGMFRHARCLSRWIYAFHQPVGFFLPLLLSVFGEKVASVVLSFGGIAVFVFTLLPALLVGVCEYGFRRIVDIL